MDFHSSSLSPALDIAVGCYLMVVAGLSFIGNLLVLIIAFRQSSKLKPPELLSVNLAVTDLGAAISMYPLAVASAWNHHWLGGDATCIYYGLAGFFFGIASIMNLTALAIVRLVASFSLQSLQDRLSWKQAKVLCVWTWLYALVWALFPLLGWGQYGPEPFGLSCSLAWGQMRHQDISFVIVMFSMNLALPSITIISSYFSISFKLYFIYKKSINNRSLPSMAKLHQRLLVIAVLMSLGFIGSWLPYGLVSLWSVFKDSRSIPPEVSLLPCLFAKTSTVYNPLIYYMFSRKFKRAVKQLLFRKMCHNPNAVTDNSICTRPNITARYSSRESKIMTLS